MQCNYTYGASHLQIHIYMQKEKNKKRDIHVDELFSNAKYGCRKIIQSIINLLPVDIEYERRATLHLYITKQVPKYNIENTKWFCYKSIHPLFCSVVSYVHLSNVRKFQTEICIHCIKLHFIYKKKKTNNSMSVFVFSIFLFKFRIPNSKYHTLHVILSYMIIFHCKYRIFYNCLLFFLLVLFLFWFASVAFNTQTGFCCSPVPLLSRNLFYYFFFSKNIRIDSQIQCVICI